MRVVVNENIKIFHGHRSVRLAKGQEVSGELAAMLLERAPSKVTPVAGEVADGNPAGTDPRPDSLENASTAPEVLAWVGDDPERAEQALEAEEARDKPRSTLIRDLTKVAQS